MIRWLILITGILGFCAVMIGAYAAHGLETNLADQGLAPEEIAKRIDQCNVAVRYHMVHTIVLLILATLGQELCWKKRTVAACFFLLGIALFSGGLYSMVFLGIMGHWAIVPSGGLCFMIGWIMVTMLGVGRQSTC